MTITFPVALELSGRACLVVGGGSEAVRRVRALLEAGANVHLVSPKLEPELERMSGSPNLIVHERAYAPEDLDEKWLAVLCDRDAELARRMGEDARKRQTFFCAIDQPDQNSFAHVGLARAGSLFVAVGTGGKVPALARRLKHEFQRLIDDPRLEAFVETLAALREQTPREERARVLSNRTRGLRLEGRFIFDEE